MRSNKKMFSYTSAQGREVFMRNSTTSKVIGEGTIQFRMDASLLFKAFIMFPNQSTFSSLLEPYIEKDSVLDQKVILWKFLKRPM